jgi:hypothetical protein
VTLIGRGSEVVANGGHQGKGAESLFIDKEYDDVNTVLWRVREPAVQPKARGGSSCTGKASSVDPRFRLPLSLAELAASKSSRT